MPRRPKTQANRKGRGRNGEGSAAANPRTEPTRHSVRSNRREVVENSRNQMPDLDRRRQAAKRTNYRPLAHNEISKANAHRQPPNPHIYRDVQLPTRVVGMHRNGQQAIQYRSPATLLPKVRA